MGIIDTISKYINPSPSVELRNVIDTSVTEIPVNMTRQRQSRKKLIDQIEKSTLTRVRRDVGNWRNAQNLAESELNPDRVALTRIYKDVVVDSHIAALIETIKNRVTSQECVVVDSNENEQDDLLGIFKSHWFEKFICYALDSYYYGYSLIQLGDAKDGGFPNLECIPFEYIIPQFHAVKTSLYGRYDMIDFTRPPWDKNTVWVNHGGLGVLNSATPLFIWKKTTMISWAEYNELFGVPFRVGRSASRDPEIRGELTDMLANMSAATWAVMDIDDEIEVIMPNGTGTADNFEKHIRLIDEQLSKLFVAQTMVMDNGSSRSQSEVHERNFEHVITSRMNFIQNLVNTQLIPKMQIAGIIGEGVEFRYNVKERLDLAAKAEIDTRFAQMFEMDIEYLNETYGTQIVGPKQGNTPTADDAAYARAVSVRNKLQSVYPQ